MSKNEGHQGDWIIVGGGYTGSLATWYTYVYPNSTVKAVWASSAPLMISRT